MVFIERHGIRRDSPVGGAGYRGGRGEAMKVGGPISKKKQVEAEGQAQGVSLRSLLRDFDTSDMYRANKTRLGEGSKETLPPFFWPEVLGLV
jgi:hypothetical protein